MRLHHRATPGIFIRYSMLTKQYYIANRLAKTILHSKDVVFREGSSTPAPNAADKAILDEHFYTVVIEEPKHTEKQPTRVESSEHQTEE